MTHRKPDYRGLRARRDLALARNELRRESVPHEAAAGVTSAAVKVKDAATERMVADFIGRMGVVHASPKVR